MIVIPSAVSMLLIAGLVGAFDLHSRVMNLEPLLQQRAYLQPSRIRINRFTKRHMNRAADIVTRRRPDV